MGKRLTPSQWSELRTAYAGGAGLRELARSMGIPQGTVLSRANREQWRVHAESAKALTVLPPERTPDKSPLEAVCASMQARGERHVERMAGTVDKIMQAVESLKGAELLDLIDRVERFDKVARRTFGLRDETTGEPNIRVVNLRFD